MIIDCHCHYTLTAARAATQDRFSFEPPDAPDAPAFDSYVSPRAVTRLAFRVLRRLLQVPSDLPPGPGLDTHLAAAYARHLLAPGPIERYVLLAFDSYHADDGTRPPPPVGAWDYGGDIYTSNSLIRNLCRREPARYLFGASIHPYREDAPRCVEEVFAAGACLLKWLPLHQNINIADERSRAVLRKCAELGLPILAHYGEEFTLRSQHREYEYVIGALEVLRELRAAGCMPPTIIAHVATPVAPWGDNTSWRVLCDALLGEFADAPLYADISALGSYGKAHLLYKFADQQAIHPKLLFGTDFPIPLGDPLLRLLVGGAYREIRKEPSWTQRFAKLCRHMGFNEIVLHRAAQFLPNVDFFAANTASAALPQGG